MFRRFFGGGRCTSQARLEGKTVIITGSNTGIGKESAKDFAKRGARVIMACRDMEKAKAAQLEVVKESGNSDVVVKKLDLASLKSVREFAEEVNREESRLDVLLNNAGIMACPQWQTEDGFEMQLGTNHLGHFLLTLQLLDLLKASAPSRVVNVSSGAHNGGKMHFDDLMLTKGYGSWKAYSQSKLANVLFTRELSRKVEGSGVTCYSLHPGVINTELGRHMSIMRVMLRVAKPFFKTPEEGAQTNIYCSVDEEAGKQTGLYYSDCAVKEPASQAKDDEAAKKLWDISLELVGLKAKVEGEAEPIKEQE